MRIWNGKVRAFKRFTTAITAIVALRGRPLMSLLKVMGLNREHWHRIPNCRFWMKSRMATLLWSALFAVTGYLIFSVKNSKSQRIWSILCQSRYCYRNPSNASIPRRRIGWNIWLSVSHMNTILLNAINKTSINEPQKNHHVLRRALWGAHSRTWWFSAHIVP